MKAFREQETAYEACLLVSTSENPPQPPTIKAVADSHYIIPTTLQRRLLAQTKPIEEAHIHRQRLTKAEETALATWIGLMQLWGWPPRVCQVRFMATDFLPKRGDLEPLGLNWIQKFLSRHPHLDSNWSQSIENDRLLYSRPENLAEWFIFCLAALKRYDFNTHDIYNMDEKGFAQGLLGTLKVVCDRRQLATEKPLKKHCGTREWVSIIECICADGEAIAPHLIFAAKRNQTDWLDMLIASGVPNGSTSATESGWTNNEIGLEWLQRSFEPQTSKRQQGQYRCILLDGHGSHLTPEAVQFCINNKIIMICLPSHSERVRKRALRSLQIIL